MENKPERGIHSRKFLPLGPKAKPRKEGPLEGIYWAKGIPTQKRRKMVSVGKEI